MALYDLQLYLFKLKNEPDMQADFLQDREGHMLRHGLNQQERQAMLDKDIQALWRIGVHPLLMAPLGRFFNLPPDQYRATLRALAGERRLRS